MNILKSIAMKIAVTVFFAMLILFYILFKTGETAEERTVAAPILLFLFATLHIGFHGFMMLFFAFRKNKDLALEYLGSTLILLLIGFPTCSVIFFLITKNN